MTVTPQPHPPRLMVQPFPRPGRQLQLAYRELNLASNGTPEQKKQIGNPAGLPRPWEPGSCHDADLRHQLWEWLDQVVTWLNHEYTWGTTDMIPSCWPLHPHLVWEIAVVADQRRRAGLATTSDALEEWHRYCLPAFIDRMRTRIRSGCEEGHQPWPGRSRHNQHTGAQETKAREDRYASDLDALTDRRSREPPATAARSGGPEHR